MVDQVQVIGVGMVPFRAPRRTERPEVMAERAVLAALEDARLDYDLVDQAVASFVDGDAGAGERALDRVGVTGIPLTHVNARGASGSSALYHARQAVLSGEAECALALGFGTVPTQDSNGVVPIHLGAAEHRETSAAGMDHADGDALLAALHSSVVQLEWMARELGISDATFAAVTVKARAHARNNPYAFLRDPLTSEEVLASRIVSGRMHALYACPASCGAAAVIVCTPRFAARHGLREDVAVLAHVMGSETGADLDSAEVAGTLGRAATRRLAEKAYARAGVGPDGIDVAEIHDQCVSNELIVCSALGFCAEDGIEAFVRSGANTYGGNVVVGPSGGLLANGDPAEATGLAQLCELTWHLRGEAGSRQVDRARTALQHNGGVGSAMSVAILQRTH